MDALLSGGCMCGAVRFELTEPPLRALYCHCKRCQRRTGSAFAVSAVTAPGSFTVTSGADRIATYRPDGGGWHKSYCSECGSHLFANHPEDGARIAVRMGALDQDPGIRPSAHQFVNYAATWLPLPDDGLPRFPERIGDGPPL